MSETELHFRIKGMHCAEEISALKKAVGPLVGGEDELSFDLLNKKMSVRGVFSVEKRELIVNAVSKIGLKASPWIDLEKDAQEATKLQTLLLILSALFLVAGFIAHAFIEHSLFKAFVAGEDKDHVAEPLVIFLYTCSIIAGGWFILPKAIAALKRLSPDMNLLMTIAVIGAAAIQEWFEAATVTFLFSLSLYLESWSVNRARRAVETLMDLAPQTARVLKEGNIEEGMDPSTVTIGSLFVVKSGERIALDGIVERGASQVNQAPITGESLPVDKAPGDAVFAGTVNGDGVLIIRSTKQAKDTTLAHIIRLVGSAQSKRSASERWVDHFAKYYTPIVIIAACLTLLIPPLFFHGNWSEWIYRALVLLVIACPCALVISTPVSMVVGLATAARNGVLVKGGLYLELMDQIKTIAFDKTGTLTKGKPVVVQIYPFNGHTEEELLQRVAALEARSQHPLAKAILEYAALKEIHFVPAENYQIIQGKGATAIYDGRIFWLGSHKYLEERGQETAEMHEKLEEMSKEGYSVIVVGNEQHVCGLIAVADEVKPQVASVIRKLREEGVEHIVMLTGDNQGTANSIGKLAGVDEIHSELLPEDKVRVIEEVTKRYGKSAMVGDGVNDAPAMARASVSVAMGAIGSDAAIETADIALMSDDLSKLPWLMHLSRKTLRMIRQNTAFSLTIKAIFVVLTFSGYAYLWAAIAADTGASLIVIFNSLRLLNVNYKYDL